MPLPVDISNTETSPSYNNTDIMKIKTKYPEILLCFTWYSLQQDKQSYIIAQLPKKRTRFSHSISSYINRFAKKNYLNLRASSQTKNNLLYFSEDDFKAYFEAMKTTQPTIKEASQRIKDLFNDNQLSVPTNNSDTLDESLVERQPHSLLEAIVRKDYIDEQIDLFLEGIDMDWEQPITLYANEDHVKPEGLFASKPQPQLQANDNIIDTSTSKKSKSTSLDMLVNFTWYYLAQDCRTYIVTQLPSTRPSLAHNLSVSINYFAKTINLRIHASAQKKNNLLYLSEKDFKAYFDTMNIMQPIIKEAAQELKDLFTDNLLCSVSTTDRNYLSQLPGFTWYQLEQDEQTYIVTELSSSQQKLSNRIAMAINHYAKANKFQLHASCQNKNNLLYLTEASFKYYFSSIAQNPPAVNGPSVKLISKFALSKLGNTKRKHTSNTIKKRASPINSSNRHPEGLVTRERRGQSHNHDATQSSLLAQLSNFISGNNDDSAMTIVQSSDSLTEDCTLAFDDFDQFDFNGLYHAWGLDIQTQDSNTIENSSVDFTQIHPTCS